MKVIETELEGVLILEPKVFRDHRGFFMESYSQRTFEAAGLKFNFVQDNHSFSKEAGTLRGLHYQKEPMAQTKLVRVISGAILDVVVDIRKGSPTFGKWISVILSADNFRQILVPKGFAHGILTLVPNTHLLYKVDQFYSPEHDRAIRWNDPELGIEWHWDNPILSEKDRNAPFLREADINFVYRGE